MVRKILVPLDGSAHGEAVLPYVQAIADKAGARVTLLASLRDDKSKYPAVTEQGQLVPPAQAYVAKKARELAAAGLNADIRLSHASLAEATAQAAMTEDVDLIAMGLHGGFRRNLAAKVMRETDRPLLLVRDGGGERPAPMAISKILVPLDGSELSHAILPVMTDLALALGAEVVLFHAVSSLGIYPTARAMQFRTPVLAKQHADEYLDAMTARLEERGIKTSRVVGIGYPADEIVRSVREVEGDMIAMSTHGHSGVLKRLLGSTTDAVLERAEVPCLVVTPPDVPKADEAAVSEQGRTS